MVHAVLESRRRRVVEELAEPRREPRLARVQCGPRVDETRVGQKTNYDKLTLEIWTNGSLGPEMALVEAAKILRKHLNPFVQYNELGPKVHTPARGMAGMDAILEAKLNKKTADWAADCVDANTTLEELKTVKIDPNNPDTYDIYFDLGMWPTYRVYAKIVDTVEGNSSRSVDATENLKTSGVVTANAGEVSVVPVPYVYTLEVESENTYNPQEKAEFSILYEFRFKKRHLPVGPVYGTR